MKTIAVVYSERWQNGDGSWSDLRIDSSLAALDAYKDGIVSDYYPGTVTISPTISGGDYDGNGPSDIAVFRPSSGLWAIRGLTGTYFGGSSDLAVPGDYNGTGVWNPGIFRSTTGLWAIKGITRAYFGSSSDLPVPADYNESGMDNIGISRSSDGLWAVRRVTRVYFGSGSDIPVTR